MLQHMQQRKENPGNPPSRWFFHKNISPLALYTYLKARFGEPNGFQMVLKQPTSDNYVHWHWSLQCHDHVIEIMGLNFYAEAYAYGISQPTESEQESLVAAIKADFAAYGPAMSSVKKSLEKWTIFVNPYQRLSKVIVHFSTKLRALDIKNIQLPGLPTTSEQLADLTENWTGYQTAYTEALGLSLTLKMSVPVLAESFINLLIFLLAKPEIKQDDRLYQDTIRREIDVRVKTLHLTCQGFASPVDASAKEFKEFHTLMNGRNDFLHGNIDPRRLKYDAVHFDGTIPLPDQYQNFSQLALINSLIHVDPDSSLRDVDTVAHFIGFILTHLDKDIKSEVEMFMNTLNPGWREDTKRAGVLFSPHMVHGVLGPSKPRHDTPSASEA